MKKVYLLIHASGLGTRDQIVAWLNNQNLVLAWRYDMNNSFYLLSEADAKTIATELRAGFPEKGRFLVTEIPDNSYGWLTGDSWYFIQHKELKKKE